MATGRRDGSLVVRIADTGCGIPDAEQEKLFDPFYTTKERGMGLGLAVVRAIMERHGGRISLRSRPGHGTVVELVLPLMAAQEA